MKWEPSAVKAQLRLTTQRLGQVQATNDSQGNITRTDIATLIQRANVPLAREKAEKLIQDEAFGDVLEVVEMQIGILLEHFHELEFGIPPSPVMVEAASTIIYAAPYVHSKDLDVIRNFLSQCLGPDFTRSATGNREHHVSRRVLQALSTPIPSANQLDHLLYDTAKSHGISWFPDPPRNTIVNALSEFLDPEASVEVDLTRLRRLCLRGIPDEPAWLRPRIWKLLFGILPTNTVLWKSSMKRQRDSYYELVSRLLQPFSQTPSSSSDDKLLSIFKQLSDLPRDMYALLEDEPESFGQCPLAEDAPDDIRISCARALENRLKVLHTQDKEEPGSSLLPEIRLEPEVEETPGISLTSFDSGHQETLTVSTTLLPLRKSIFGKGHEKHCLSLLRLLYLHVSINPGNLSPYTASFLVPLYSAMLQEVDTEDLTHVEADTFWLLEAMIAEFSALEDESGTTWMKKLSERLSWADYDLFTELELRGLDPALPHYSYRWLVPVLTYTLPLQSLFLVWDALFSRPPQERGTSPKLDYLVDICTSMLIRAKNHLHLLNRAGSNSHSLWADRREISSPSNHSPDAFVESLAFLRAFDLRHVGGIERVLQTASELIHRHEQESLAAQQPSFSLGSRFNLWRSYPQTLPDGSKFQKDVHTAEDPSDTMGPNHTPSLASKISTTVWRGITNQSAMDVPSEPPSPVPSVPPSPVMNASATTTAPLVPSTQVTANIWGYAEKLKDSDTVATLSKVGSNWRAKGLLGSWGTSLQVPSLVSPPMTTRENDPIMSPPFVDSPRLFSPPPTSSRSEESVHAPPAMSPQSTGGLMEKTKSLFSARSPPPVEAATPKSAPRPLLLGSAGPVVTGRKNGNGHPRTSSLMSTPDTDEWADVMRLKRQHFHRDSQSSVSSLSPSDAFVRVPKSSKSDWESDTNPSRIVSLNRRSVSPMAPNFRIAQVRPHSRASSASSDIHSPPVLAKSPLQASSLVGRLHNLPPLDMNTGTVLSVPMPSTSNAAAESESSDTTSNALPAPSRKSSWKTISPVLDSVDHPEASLNGGPTRSSRVRTKRHPRPANLQIQDSMRPHATAEQKNANPSPSKLTVEWPGDDQDNITTPKASSFDSDEHAPVPYGMVRSPRRPRKVSSGDPERPRKISTDNATDDRPRKVSTGHRSRKISTESREVPRSRRESAAEDGDDEGYDELLSAYESEDVPNGSSLR